MRKSLAIIFICLLVISCQKNKVNHSHPEMIGTWAHYPQPGQWFIIYIFDNGRGSMYSQTDAENDFDTQGHAWIVKNDELRFSRTQPYIFHIGQYPLVADTLLISGGDTINPGDTYMILDGDYFLRIAE